MARLAVLTSSFPESEDDASGHFVRAEVMLSCSQGHDVTVIAPGPTTFDSQANAYRIRRLGKLGAFGPPGVQTRLKQDPRRAMSLCLFAWRARQALAELGPFDRIIAHWLVPSGALLLFGADTELEVVAHGSDVELLLKLPRSIGAGFLSRLKKRRATLRLVSEAQRNKLVTRFGLHSLPNNYVRPCAFDVPVVTHRDPPVELELSKQRPLIAIVARLVPEKRVDTALSAATVIPHAQVIVVGDGPQRAELQHAFPHAQFLGQLPRPLTLRLIAAADVLLHASQLEGAPTVVREARALGTPVVAVNSGDLRAWSLLDPGLIVVGSS